MCFAAALCLRYVLGGGRVLLRIAVGGPREDNQAPPGPFAELKE